MFEYSVSKDTKQIKSNNDEREILRYFLEYLLTLIVKELKMSVE